MLNQAHALNKQDFAFLFFQQAKHMPWNKQSFGFHRKAKSALSRHLHVCYKLHGRESHDYTIKTLVKSA